RGRGGRTGGGWGSGATRVQTRGEVLEMVDHVLVMSVDPGFGGQKFIPASLDKVRKLATMRTAKRANFRIEIDGGIGVDTIAESVGAGVEIMVAGNARFGQGESRENTRHLLKLAAEANLQRV